MCSIIGYIDKVLDIDIVQKNFSNTTDRGPDATKFIKIPDGYLGFNRLAIMGLDESGMQPFVLDGSAVVCNGEIYQFRTLKEQLSKKYQFVSESDCEIILPLYFEYGLEMFKMLDSEFALIIYDAKRNSLIAARDPIGIRPLYYGYTESNQIIFASTPIALLGIVKVITPFPPGHYYLDGKFYQYCDVTSFEKEINDSLEVITSSIREKLITGVKKRLDADAPIGFLLSGGLDSSLVCAIAQKESSIPIETFAIGMETDAIDLKYAQIVASYIRSNHHQVIINKEDVINSLDEVIKILASYDITTIRASIGMYLLAKAISKTTPIKVLLTGEISDELFGYKYTDYAPSAKDFQEESIKRVKELHMYDVLRADRCISSNSLEARVPFGDLDFVNYVLSINPEIKMNRYNMGKYLLRKAFEGDYLPEEILYREKAAFSDAVGHSLVNYLKEYAENFYSDEEFVKKCMKYPHPKPFTKESLLYREIFSKHYPEQDAMITNYWMPNQSWKGCEVDDPSARFLKNYGKSGQ